MAAAGGGELMSLAASLQALMHEQIPLTRLTGFKISGAAPHSIETGMPFQPVNRNDKNTAFAGSISALANVSGWALLSLLTMQARGVRPTVAIYESKMRFRRPIDADLRAQASIGPKEKIAMLEALARTGDAKVQVAVNVKGSNSDDVAAHMDGYYLVRMPR